jgi:hypothetical protein
MINALLLLVLLIPASGFAEDPKLDSKAQKIAPTAFADEKPKPVLHWGAGEGKSYLVPALDITGFLLILNQFDRHFIDDEVYHSDFSSFKKNLTGRWVSAGSALFKAALLRVAGCFKATGRFRPATGSESLMTIDGFAKRPLNHGGNLYCF